MCSSTICSGFKKVGVIPFDPETILKLTPPTENNFSSQQNSSTSSASQQTNSTSSASQQNNSTSSDAACSEDDDADKENECDELGELYMAPLKKGTII